VLHRPKNAGGNLIFMEVQTPFKFSVRRSRQHFSSRNKLLNITISPSIPVNQLLCLIFHPCSNTLKRFFPLSDAPEK
jgi:hypothetical protein